MFLVEVWQKYMCNDVNIHTRLAMQKFRSHMMKENIFHP